MCHVVHAIQYCYRLGPLSNNEDQRRGIRWTPFTILEDLDFADDLALLSHTRQHIQEKTDRLSMFSNQVGLRISLKKTEAMCVNVPSPTKIRVRGQDIPYTNKFTYLGSVLCQDGGTSVDIQSRLNKARNAFMSLRSVWRSASYSTKTKLRIYQSCVLSTLLYGSECWRMTEQDLSKLASFHTANLRKILRIFWPQKISNDQLLRQTKQEDIRTLVNRRRWRWIGHVMRKASNNIARIAMHWTPEGKRSRGRPKTTWRRTVEKRLRGLNYSWSTIEKLAKDRQGWKDFVAALCATQAWLVVSYTKISSVEKSCHSVYLISPINCWKDVTLQFQIPHPPTQTMLKCPWAAWEGGGRLKLRSDRPFGLMLS